MVLSGLFGELGRRGGAWEAWAMVRECFGEAWGHGESWGMVEKSLGRLGDDWEVWGGFGECSESFGEAQGGLGVCTIDVWLF